MRGLGEGGVRSGPGGRSVSTQKRHSQALAPQRQLRDPTSVIESSCLTVVLVGCVGPPRPGDPGGLRRYMKPEASGFGAS